MNELPERPAPPSSVADRVRTWVEWVGLGRVVATAVVVIAVLAGAYWLVKPPPATSESKLPYAGASTTATTEVAPTTTSESVPEAAPPPTAEVVVHVAGAVNAGGVYRLEEGARVLDAVAAAGGMATDADQDAVNLAAPVRDGERVYVPTIGEPVPLVVTGAGGGSGGSGAGGDTDTTPTGPVNINSASADELDSLPGVGPATAAAIIAHRDQYGPFGSIEDLADVRGIGPSKLDALRGLVTI